MRRSSNVQEGVACTQRPWRVGVGLRVCAEKASAANSLLTAQRGAPSMLRVGSCRVAEWRECGQCCKQPFYSATQCAIDTNSQLLGCLVEEHKSQAPTVPPRFMLPVPSE